MCFSHYRQKRGIFIFIFGSLVNVDRSMTAASVHINFKSVVVAKLVYAASSWWGLATAYDRNRLQAVIRRGIRGIFIVSSSKFQYQCHKVKIKVTIKKLFIHTGASSLGPRTAAQILRKPLTPSASSSGLLSKSHLLMNA